MNQDILLATVFEKGPYPNTTFPEMAVCGRSNCGKSSFMNCLLGIKNIARVSSKPGKTASINFYRYAKKIVLVDLPGYGFARASWETRDKWRENIEHYLFSRSNLFSAFVLSDVRRGLQKEEVDLVDLFRDRGLSVGIVFTKTDKLSSSELSKSKTDMLAQINKLWQDMGDSTFFVSSLKKTGVDLVKKHIERISTKE